MATLFFLNHASYFNRIVKPISIKEATTKAIKIVPNVNFNYNDGVNSSQILNIVDSNLVYSMINYVYVNEFINTETGTQEYNSRWYVINFKKVRGNQYKITLRRDVISDFKNQFLNSDCYIERGITDNTDPAFYNNENIAVNQISINETELRDKTGISWIVGYCARHSDSETWDGKTVSYVSPEDRVSHDTYETLDQFYLSVFGTANPKFINFDAGPEFSIDYYNAKQDSYTQLSISNTHNVDDITAGKVSTGEKSSMTSYATPKNNAYNYSTAETNWVDNLCTNINSYNTYTILMNATLKAYSLLDDSVYTDFYNKYNKKTISINGTLYFMTIKKSSSSVVYDDYLSAANPIYLTARSDLPFSSVTGTRWIKANIESYQLDVTLTEIWHDDYTYSTKLDVTRQHITEAPYDIFVVPYTNNDKDTIRIKYQDSKYECNYDAALGIINQLATVSDKAIYDIQILPYCPFINYKCITEDSDGVYIDLDIMTEHVDYTLIDKGKSGTINGIGSVIIYLTSDRQFFNIPYKIDKTDSKTDFITKKYRLCSPTFNGAYELNPYMNHDGINYFNVSLTCLPYNVWIRIKPQENFLNSNLPDDEKDSKGLILNGNFSIARVTDTWAEYELNNKNYNAIFDREVKNMKVSHQYQQVSNILGAGVSAGVTGLGAGMMMGGPLGIAAGTASAVAGIADYAINEKLFNETLNAKKDIRNLQLDNIKAQPESLSKLTAFNIDSKFFPYIEEYDCTQSEKNIVNNYFNLYSYSINAYGSPESYIGNFIKGSIIKLNADSDEYQMSEDIKRAINEEFNAGFYLE